MNIPLASDATNTASIFTPQQQAAAIATGVQSGLIAKAAPKIGLPDNLLAALEAALDSRARIKPLQEEMRELVEDAESDIERQARLYQTDLIEWQLTRAADLAEIRLAYLRQIRTQSQVDAELKLIESDIVHYAKFYGWGFDPRPDSPLAVIPFELFEFQQRYVKWLDYLVFTKRTSGVVKKARDMGATDTALLWIFHKWLFIQGFSAILLSANEDLVDSKRNENTLFEKIRFQCRLSPQWILPEGFDCNRDTPYMNIRNEVKNSALHGYAPTENVGRQSRATVILRDEYAAWPYGGFPQHTALSATSKSSISVSSVQGKNNKFADLCLNGVTPIFEMDWREHPWKDDRWYNSLTYGYISDALTEQEIAQEIDRNFDASQPGKVFTNLKEEYCFITWKELIAFYEEHDLGGEFKTNTGLVRIPSGFEWGRTFDYGQSEGHKWTYAILARPPESYPLNDSVFIFCCQPMPQNGTTEQQAVSQWQKWENTLGLRNEAGFVTFPQYSECSHEQNDLRDTLLQIYGESWTAWDTDYHSGLSQIRQWFSLIDQHKPNPIRPNLMGRATIYFVAPDSEYMPVFNEREGKWFVTPSQTEWGFKLLREELSEYHYPPEERFKPLPKQRPLKKKDDCIDTLRGHSVHWGAIARPLSSKEKYQRRLAAMLPPAAQMSRPDVSPEITLAMAEARLKQELRQEGELVPSSSPFQQENEKFNPWANDDGGGMQADEPDFSGGW